MVGYNVQVAVDTEHHLIVTHEVTNDGSDRAQLANVACRAKQVLGVDELEAVADRGYYSSEEILTCHQAGITITLPKPITSGIEAKGRFGKQDFVYLSDEDTYRCPAGESSLTTTPMRSRISSTPLLDQCLSELRYQTALHDRKGTADHALGA